MLAKSGCLWTLITSSNAQCDFREWVDSISKIYSLVPSNLVLAPLATIFVTAEAGKTNV